jgi:predicted DNA-binding mobile mystery protein A
MTNVSANLWVMNKRQKAAQARRELDRRFATSEIASMRARPHAGWVKAIRAALGMSQRDLASRLGVSDVAVHKLERSEQDGRISLAKLAEIAAAMDCTMVYALVPNSSLEDTVQRQARRVAEARLGYVADTMSLEDQSVAPDRRAGHAEAYGRELIAGSDIWRSDTSPVRPTIPDPSGGR